MPELPEVEVLVRHLAPVLVAQTIREVEVRRPKSVRPQSVAEFSRSALGMTITGVRRRAKYLLFDLRGSIDERVLIGHLGMTGRMFLQPRGQPLPRHAAVVLGLGAEVWVFEDTRYFGRMAFDDAALAGLGPEPFVDDFSADYLREALRGCRQAIKVKLLDQSLVAGVGNIYASEALFRAGISPRRAAGRLKPAELGRVRDSIRDVLAEAIRFGSTVPLDFAGRADGAGDGLFYYGRPPGAPDYYTERLLVYDRAGRPCVRCGTAIRKVVQANRSTYFCTQCQR